MCLLKLNHHDLTSKIHTVKSYKLTQAEDEIKRSKCTRFVHLHDLCSLSGACAVVFQLCRSRLNFRALSVAGRGYTAMLRQQSS